MSDATAAPATPEPTATPGQPDEPLGHDGPTFVHNGIIRFPMGDRVVRIRRPFLGELKELRLARQEVQDYLTEESMRVQRIGEGYKARAVEIVAAKKAGELDDDAYAAAISEVAGTDRATARELDDVREQSMLDWWSTVFAKLALDPVPDQMGWPTWMLNPELSGMVFSHWRTVPSGPG